MPTHAIFCVSSALPNAAVSTRPPRLVFTSMLPRFIRLNFSSFMRWYVSSMSGQCRVTIWHFGKSSSTVSTYLTPISIASLDWNRSYASTSHPMPNKILAVHL